jgi:hypothetical protein
VARAQTGVLALLMAIAAVLIYRKGLGLTFYYDEWNFVMNRRSWSTATLLEPHNEHFVLLPVVLFKLLFATVGLADYWVYRVVLIAAHLLCVALLFLLARRRVGDTLALVLAAPLLLLGAAWNDLLVPFQITYVGSTAAGLGALLALERRDRLGDALACVLVAVALACSGVGITFAAAVLIETVLPADRARRVWVAGVPIVLYLVWSLAYGNPTATSGGRTLTDLWQTNLPGVPGHVATSLAGSFGAVIGLGVDWGRPLALVAIVLVAIRLVRGPVTGRFLALLGAAAVYWGVGGLFRAHLNAPLDSRYLYVGAILVLLLAIELLPPLAVTPRLAALLVVVVAASGLANFGPLRSGSQYLQEWSRYVTVELAALELAGPATDPAFRPDPTRAPDITAGKYFDAVDQYGSPAAEVEEIPLRAEPERQAADATLLGALGVKLEPGSRGSRCRRTGQAVEVELPPRGILVRATDAPVELRLRAFAGAYPEAAFATVPAQAAQTLRIPERDGIVWRASLRSAGPIEICAP